MIISIQTITSSILATVDPRHELLTEIIGRYRLGSKSLHESQSMIPFKIRFPIHDIIKIDGSTNECVFRASIEIIYQFEFLHWDSNDTQNRYYDIDDITIAKSILQTLWVPDIHLKDEEFISFNMEHESARINRNGYVQWTRRGLFTIVSLIDLTYYPFDHQYIRIKMSNKQKGFKLQYEKNSTTKISLYTTNSFNLLTRLLHSMDINIDESNASVFQEYSSLMKPTLSRGWYVRTLGIESKPENNDSSNDFNIYILLQRRREPHIYTTILPTLFFSIFILIFYFSSIKSYQRLTISILHILATLSFIIHLDRRISAEQLPYTPLIIRYLSIIFLIEILSLFFDHIIHSIYFGGIHFVSNWLRRKDNYETQPARLSHVKLLPHGLYTNESENDEGTNILMKQLIEREESLKYEDNQQFQWHQQACLSECLCCTFFLIVIIAVFIFIFFILPTFTLSKMT